MGEEDGRSLGGKAAGGGEGRQRDSLKCTGHLQGNSSDIAPFL